MKRWKKWGVRSAALWGLAVLFAGVLGWAGSPVYGASVRGQMEGQLEEQRQGQWRGQPGGQGTGTGGGQGAGQGWDTGGGQSTGQGQDPGGGQGAGQGQDTGGEQDTGGGQGTGQGQDTGGEQGTEAGVDQALQDMGLQDEMEGLQQFLDDVMGQQDGGMGGLSFWGLMKELMKGNLKGILGQTGMGLKNALFSQVDRGGQMLFQVAAIGMIGAVFTNVSSVFKGGQISDTGFFVTYLLMFTCLAASFSASLQVAAQVMEQILEFMKLLMPAYYMAVAFSGGSMSALSLYECMLGAVTGVQWLCSTVLLSMVRIYVLMVLGSHVAKEALLSKLTELLEQAVVWSLRTLTGLVVGFHLIQAMILPYADAAGQTGMKRLMEMIPGLGQGAGAMAQMVLGSGVLIKNTMGAAAVVVLAVISVVPVMKLTVLMVMYQCVAAVMQPVCDKRVVSCVSGVSKGHKLLLQIVLYSMFLFMIAIAITCASTNVNYFAS